VTATLFIRQQLRPDEPLAGRRIVDRAGVVLLQHVRTVPHPLEGRRELLVSIDVRPPLASVEQHHVDLHPRLYPLASVDSRPDLQTPILEGGVGGHDVAPRTPSQSSRSTVSGGVSYVPTVRGVQLVGRPGPTNDTLDDGAQSGEDVVRTTSTSRPRIRAGGAGRWRP